MTTEQVVRLSAAEHVRHVATPEGAAFYNLPIGTPITDHQIHLKIHKAALIGLKPPANGLSGPPVKAPSSASTPKATPKKSTLTGPQHFKVGSQDFAVPDGSKLYGPTDGAGFRYVFTPEGKIHAFTSQGEVPVPEDLQSSLSTSLGSSHDYQEMEFDHTAPSYHPSALPVGTPLHDTQDTPVFSKTADNEYSAEGAPDLKVDDEFVKKHLDSGNLKVPSSPETDNLEATFKGSETGKFADLTAEQFKAWMDAAPEGQKVHDDKGKTLVKTGSSGAFALWKDSPADPAKTDFGMSSQQLAFMAGKLQPGPGSQDQPNEPDVPEEVPNEPGAAEGALTDVANGKTDAASGDKPGAGQQWKANDSVPDKAALDAMPIGMEVAFPNIGGGTVFATKDEQGAWKETASGINVGGLISWGFKHAPVENQARISKVPDQQAPAPEGEKPVAPEAAPTIAETAQKVTAEFDAAQAAKPSKPKPLGTGSPITSAEDLKGLAVGSKVQSSTESGKPVFFTKSGADSWIFGSGVSGGNSQILWEGFHDLGITVHSLPGSGPQAAPATTESGVLLNDGDKITDAAMLNAMAVGAIVHDSSGSLDIEMTKLPNGTWHSSTMDMTFDSGNLLAAINAGGLYAGPGDPDKTMHAEPIAPVAPVLVEGQKLTVAELTGLPAHAVVGVQKKDGTAVPYVKLGDTTYLAPWGGTVGAGTVEDYAGIGQLVLQKMPNADGSADVPATPGDGFQFTHGGQVFSKDDVQEVYDALTKSKSFQIAYALKGLDKNPLAQQDSVTLKGWAAEAHPELQGKAALVATLSDKLGIQAVAAANGPIPTMVQIGSTSPKKNAFGVTGGSFSTKDIQDAIDILEAYNGKIFKNELNNKGNPLGALSFKDVVGFEKDKAKAKQNAIEFLKTKLAGAQPAAYDPKLPTISPNEAGTKHYEPGIILNSFDAVALAEPGTHALSKDGIPYTKATKTMWHKDGDTSPVQWGSGVLIDGTVTAPGDAPAAPPKPMTKEEIEGANIGTEVLLNPKGQTGLDIPYKKTGDDEWTRTDFGPGEEPFSIGSKNLSGSKYEVTLVKAGDGTVAPTLNSDMYDELQIGDSVESDKAVLDAVPKGWTLQDPITKQKYQHVGTAWGDAHGQPWSSDDLTELAANFDLVSKNPDESVYEDAHVDMGGDADGPKVGDYVSNFGGLVALPPGSHIKAHLPGKFDWTLQRNDEAGWENLTTHELVSTADLSDAMASGYIQVLSIGPDDKNSSGPKVGDKILDAKALDALPAGYSVNTEGFHAGGFVKNVDGSWSGIGAGNKDYAPTASSLYGVLAYEGNKVEVIGLPQTATPPKQKITSEADLASLPLMTVLSGTDHKTYTRLTAFTFQDEHGIPYSAAELADHYFASSSIDELSIQSLPAGHVPNKWTLGMKITSLDDLNALPEGMVVGNGPVSGGKFAKEADGTFTNVATGGVGGPVSADFLFTNGGHLTVIDGAPPAKTYSVGDVLVKQQDLADLPVGYSVGGWKKTSTGEFQDANGFTKTAGGLVASGIDLKITAVPGSGPAPKTFNMGDPITGPKALNDLPEGYTVGVVAIGSGGFIKGSDGKFHPASNPSAPGQTAENLWNYSPHDIGVIGVPGGTPSGPKLPADGELISEQSVLDALAPGQKITYVGSNLVSVMTKNSEGHWNSESGGSLDSQGLVGLLHGGHVSITMGDNKPATPPVYATTPVAVAAKLDAPEWESLPVTTDPKSFATGAVLKLPNSGPNTYAIKKSSDPTSGGTWAIYIGGKNTSTVSDTSIGNAIGAGDAQSANIPVTNLSGVLPGKYFNDSGKMYMVVKADGSGVYVNSKGTVTALTAKQVAGKNALEPLGDGLNNYVGVPDSMPTVTPKAPAAKKKPLSSEVIEDGTYFAGDPNDPKTPVYNIKDGAATLMSFKKEVTVQATGNSGSTFPATLKVGQTVSDWALKYAPVGSTLAQGSDAYIRTEDGWQNQNSPGKVWQPSELSHLAWYKYKITGLGDKVPSDVTANKIKTLFNQGKLLDKYGNSVLPKGYTGAVTVFGFQTTVGGLLEAKKYLDETGGIGPVSALQQHGAYYVSALLKQYGQDQSGGGVALNVSDYRKFFNQKIADLTADLDTSEIPKGDAAKYFNYDPLGQPTMPAAAFGNTGHTAGDKAKWIKAVSAQFGDGTIIGQGVTKMTTDERSEWIDDFLGGDFAGMYTLEVQALARNNEAHPKGWLHPGYSGNPDTNKVAWGPAVQGEISAQKDVPGNWTKTSYYTKPSMAEIDNYLILAQMQNPTFLSGTEKRNWVNWHRSHNKTGVDNLSFTAQSRAKAGGAPLSPPPTWTDNLQPAKSYDSLFDDTPNPVGVWGTEQATDYWADHQSEPDLKATADAMLPDWSSAHSWMIDPGSNGGFLTETVEAYFSKRAADAYAKSLIPVYTLSPQQTLKQGTHPIREYTDQFNREYVFKTPQGGDRFRSEVEASGNNLGRLFGYQTGAASVEEIDGTTGIMMAKVPASGDLMNPKWGTLSGDQIGEVASEHVLDWMLENDDTKGDNMLVRPDGHLVGIDKGRSFVSYGTWQGLNPEQMDRNANTVYHRMFDAMQSGAISKEQADAAYLRMQRTIKRVQRTPVESVRKVIEDGQASRTKPYKIAYSIEGKQVPQTIDGLVMAVEDRRAHLDTDFANLWANVYKDAGYGDLPEIPKNELGDIPVGLDDPQLHTAVLAHRAFGRTTMIGGMGASLVGGTMLLWSEKNNQNSDLTTWGTGFLANKKQGELLKRLKSEAKPGLGGATPAKATVQGFSEMGYDNFWNSIYVGSKHANYHATDHTYTQAKIDGVTQALASIDQDIAAWKPDLQKNTTRDGQDAYKFPSGNVVQMRHVDQYKMMLDHYKPQAEKVVQAFKDQGKVTPYSEQYVPKEITSTGTVYHVGPVTYTELTNGDVLKKDSDTAEVSIVPSTQLQAALLSNPGGYTKDEPPKAPEAPPVPAAPLYTVVKTSRTHERKAKFDPTTGEKSTMLDSGPLEEGTYGAGSDGSEYEIKLNTGESIYFRNSDDTQTVRGQHGKLEFKTVDAKGEAELAASLARIDQAMRTYGLNFDPADMTSAELIYWREYYGLLVDRDHTGNPQMAKARKLLDAKHKEIGGPLNEFPERLSEALSPEEERDWWRSIFRDSFDTATVDKFISEQGFLPHFDHQDMAAPGAETGKPYWLRFDVDPAKLREQGVALVSDAGSSPLNKVQGGGMLSGEERLRTLGFNKFGQSPGRDAQLGSSHNIYTRIYPLGSINNTVMYDPAAMARTRTYSFGEDTYGRLSARAGSSPSDPLKAIKDYAYKPSSSWASEHSSNETLLPHAASVLDTVEVFAFPDYQDRDAAIQFLKSHGIYTIRGLPVEDRMIVRSVTNWKNAIAKVKEQWAKEKAAHSV